MAANKKKTDAKVRDLKPTKDAKGGAAKRAASAQTAGPSAASRNKMAGRIIIMK
jgi:hypothetical protein